MLQHCLTNLKILSPFSYRVEIKEEEGIFASSYSDLHNNKKTQKVYWIYKESSDEQAFFNGGGGLKKSDRCGKIFVMLGGCSKKRNIFLKLIWYRFPSRLKKCVGARREEGLRHSAGSQEEKPEKVQESHQGFHRSSLSPTQVSHNAWLRQGAFSLKPFLLRNNVLFLEFPGRCDRSHRLSHYVRAEFMRHQEQQTYASSSSASDSDV